MSSLTYYAKFKIVVMIPSFKAPRHKDEQQQHDPKTHKRLKRTLCNQTKQDRMPVFEEILFFKTTNNRRTNKSLIFLSPVKLDTCRRKWARGSAFLGVQPTEEIVRFILVL